MRSFFQNSCALILRNVHVHRNTMPSLRSGRENVPPLLLLYERQKIILPFDLKLQCITPFGSKAKTQATEHADSTDCIRSVLIRAIRGQALLSYFLSSTSTYSASITPSS